MGEVIKPSLVLSVIGAGVIDFADKTYGNFLEKRTAAFKDLLFTKSAHSLLRVSRAYEWDIKACPMSL